MNRRSLFAGLAGIIAGAGAASLVKAGEPAKGHFVAGPLRPDGTADAIWIDANGAHSHAIYWTAPPTHQHSVQVVPGVWRSL